MKKICTILGARPQFIKSAPLSKLLKNKYIEIIIHTGQHFDVNMSDVFFHELVIAPPKYNLNINKGLHGEQTGKMMIDIENVLIDENPSLIIVYGDTNSTLAGSLVAAKLHIPVVHIEAGLRSFNNQMPEEINRIVSDHISDYLFAPTPTAINNLSKENLSEKTFLTGDIMVDSLLYSVNHCNKSKILKNLSLSTNGYYLLTLHRPYNVDEHKTLANIFLVLSKLNKKIIFPIHPRTKSIIYKEKVLIPKNIHLLEPLGHLDFVQLLLNSSKVLTDSGGIQKEAYILQKPCITLRTETEWIETVKSGWNLLIDPSRVDDYSSEINTFQPESSHIKIFGENVADKMYEIIKTIL